MRIASRRAPHPGRTAFSADRRPTANIDPDTYFREGKQSLFLSGHGPFRLKRHLAFSEKPNPHGRTNTIVRIVDIVAVVVDGAVAVYIGSIVAIVARRTEPPPARPIDCFPG